MQSMGSLNWTRLGDFTFTFHSHALEKEMATHSSTLAWKIPWTPGLYNLCNAILSALQSLILETQLPNMQK